MSRRYSDQPINLIARIPSPEQMSAARPKQRSFIQLVMESGATCARGIADMVAQFHRLGRSISPPMNRRQAENAPLNSTAESAASPSQPVAEKVYLSDDRLARWNALLDATIPRIQSDEQGREPIPASAARSVPRVAESHPLDEVVALRVELLAHQQEVARLSVQLQELKSMVGSQQQVLIYLGQELEAQQLPMVMAAAQAAPSVKKARVMRAKSGGKELSASRKVSREPSLNL
ncbi:hypothetical protein [Nitrospira lenta]|uniref:Uncharacterized protein n=1 Tax=Nitrospira lenta TaxID=1436998 RepID=A0A330L5H7_9BACT|nr:hypothetical protein [Nitrospira lenta]SPP64580.1 hypothetical protein NITLEN_20220 [Nitrospira lenta]